MESPRWLISKDRDEEAKRILVKYHADGDAADPLVRIEMEEIREALRIDLEVVRNSSYVSFLKTRGNRLRLVLVVVVGFFSQWSGNGLISVCVEETKGVTRGAANMEPVLLNVDPRLDRLYVPRDADVDQRCAFHLVADIHSLRGLFHSRSVWTEDTVPDIDRWHAGLVCQ